VLPVLPFDSVVGMAGRVRSAAWSACRKLVIGPRIPQQTEPCRLIVDETAAAGLTMRPKVIPDVGRLQSNLKHLIFILRDYEDAGKSCSRDGATKASHRHGRIRGL
jgi:hypothetical protein